MGSPRNMPASIEPVRDRRDDAAEAALRARGLPVRLWWARCEELETLIRQLGEGAVEEAVSAAGAAYLAARA